MVSDPVSIFWFRRDLRLADNPALAAAAAAGPVCAVFISDDRLRCPAGDARLSFLGRSLRELLAATGGALHHRSGDPRTVLEELAAEVGATSVYATDDHGPYGRRRDTEVGERLAEAGIQTHYIDSNYAVAPGSVRTRTGGSYKVFTPFYRSWAAHGWSASGDAPNVEWVSGSRTEPLPDDACTAALPPAGEEAAAERLERFLDGPVHDYADQRDLPAVDGTSRLSPYLKWGTLHPRQILGQLGDGAGEELFRAELAWREFYADVLHARPESARQAYVPKMSGMEVDSGPSADLRFEAWVKGETGFPIVDAGMRQLRSTGWMHNRVRMITASFLVKDLHIDWRRGARWFMAQLVDGDLASNNHGWQWVAGTGTDASPYFRVFNPISQGRKFDPDAHYVRTWVPEIAHLGSKTIHEPWTDPAGPPMGYPGPIVDHAEERLESLRRYDELKASWQ